VIITYYSSYIVTPECSAAIKKIGVHRHDLEDLPINTLLASLYGNKVISLEEKRTMDNTALPSDQMTYLLDNVLMQSLKSGDTEKFSRFCEVLEDKGHTAMARRLGLLIHCSWCIASSLWPGSLFFFDDTYTL